MSYCNREKAGVTRKESALAARQERYLKVDPHCKVCSRKLTFEEFTAGKLDLCPAKECRSKINSENSKKQDKSKISEQIKSSEKWRERMREALLRKRSRVEISLEKVFTDVFGPLETQVPLSLDDGSIAFVDFQIKNVLVEIDGPYHTEESDRSLNEHCIANQIQLVRFKVNRHWSEIMSDIGRLILEVQGKMGA